MFAQSILLLLATASLLEARSVHDTRHLHSRVHKRATADDSLTLSADAVQIGSTVDGSTQVGAAEVGQAKSATSTNNFINNCSGKTLTNGLQITTGSCNGITMGDIPAKTAMVSSIITFPLPGSTDIQSDTTFNITVQMSNLIAGSFTNADATYYAAPQALSGGKVVGHTHITVQNMGASLNPTTALDPTVFAFFKGINDAGNGNGLLSATVTGGLPAGNYRVCTIASSSNHQPVLMPVAQRGTADDCTKFTVSGTGTTINDASNGGVKGIAAAALAASAVAAGPGFVVSSTASVSDAATASVEVTSSISTTSKVGKANTTSISKASSVTSSVVTKETSTTAKVDKASKSTISSAVKSTTSVKPGKVISTGAPFTNTTIASATKAGKTTKAAVATASTSLSVATQTSSVSVGNGKGGKGNSIGTGSSTTEIIVKKITIIESFFEFTLSLGGLCPSVSKNNNNKFAVLEELFDDLASAASAACGHQFSTCISFSEAGFSFEECSSQQDTCTSAAITASASSTPAVLTATVTVPITASVTGSVISEQTLTTTVSVAPSVAVADVATAAPEASTTSLCALVSSTIFIDAVQPTTTQAVLAQVTASTCAVVTSIVTVDAPTATPIIAAQAFSNSTSTTSSSASTTILSASSASSTGSTSSGALGGIEAPAITDSGDATRPFLVNGNTFTTRTAAVQRSCDVQFNKCANAFNGGTAVGFVLSDCSVQETKCVAAG